MIRRLIRQVLNLSRSGQKIYSSEQLGFDASCISKAALKTVHVLQHHGFEAYVVGGAVRDLLMGYEPKDFDVATNAKPEQVMCLFRRAWLIGRRFPIVHVRFGHETIEVTTFRGDGSAQTSEHGQILRDNVFGSLANDAFRRDFGANALYYDPLAEVVHDFHHGIEDIRSNVLKMIGQPEQRYREDPVRMLRAVRFAAKLGLDIEARTRKPFARLAYLLDHVSEGRRFDEITKFLTCGASAVAISRLYQERLYSALLPLLDEAFSTEKSHHFIDMVLSDTDNRVYVGKPVNPAFAFATILWESLNIRWQKLKDAGEPFYPALIQAIDEIIDIQFSTTSIPKRVLSDMREIWQLQPQFENRRGKRPYRLTSHSRFRAAYDFMLLRAESGYLSKDIAKWWILFLENPQEAEKNLPLLAHEKTSKETTRRRKKRNRKNEKLIPEAVAVNC